MKASIFFAVVGTTAVTAQNFPKGFPECGVSFPGPSPPWPDSRASSLSKYVTAWENY
jgi:hypothetical protein